MASQAGVTWTSKGPKERKLPAGHLTLEEFTLWQVVPQAWSVREQRPWPLPPLLQLLPEDPPVPRRQGPCVPLWTDMQPTDALPCT